MGGGYIETSDDRKKIMYFRGKMTGKVVTDFAKFNSIISN
jgi:hypothetical protein